MKKNPFAKALKQFFDSKDILFKLQKQIYFCDLKDSQYMNLPKTLQADIEIFLYKKTKILANAICTPHDKTHCFVNVSVLVLNNTNNNRKRSFA